jgi:AraC family transcriptional regulator
MFLREGRSRYLAKIAVDLKKALRQRAVSGAPGSAAGRRLASGDGWRVLDVLCTSGPDDRSFEEQHGGVSIAVVAAGTFQYRAANQRQLMTPGSFLLGNPGQAFECSHDHGAGDRCISFQFDPRFFASIVPSRPRFAPVRLPPLRESAALIARTFTALEGTSSMWWEELAVLIAAHAARFANDASFVTAPPPPNALARVTRAIRTIEEDPAAELSLRTLASDANLSPYHFLRTFTQLAGATPHQFALRARLREAALRLATETSRITDIAYDCGFGDLSNFNRTFRAEFGVAPRAYRQRA